MNAIMTEQGIEQDGIGRPRWVVAANEIAQSERQHAVILGRNPGVEAFAADLSPDERMARIAIGNAFYEISTAQGANPDSAREALEQFARRRLPNMTLARIENDGEWDAPDEFEHDLFPVAASVLFDEGYDDIHFIPNTSTEARIKVDIPAGLTKQDGFVALRRHRQFLVARSSRNPDLPDLHIDKKSTFALDINKFDELSAGAAAEVRLIIAATMYQACNWQALQLGLVDPETLDDESWFTYYRQRLEHQLTGDQDLREAFTVAMADAERLYRAIRRYDMSLESLRGRINSGSVEPTRLHDPSGIRFVEDSLHKRSKLLTPASTAYYIHTHPR